MLAPLVLDLQQAATTAPVITVQPQSITTAAGAIATFGVVVVGVNVVYQWFKNGSPISGATSATLNYGPTVYPSDSGDQFYVIVSNSAGSVTSGTAVLTVILANIALTPPTQTTANDIILGALLQINAYSPGQPLQPSTTEVGLATLNDLLDSLSNDKNFIYTQEEYVFPWVTGQFKYTIGNPIGGNFSGTVIGNSATIVNVTVPTGLAIGATLTDLCGALPAGTTVLGLGTNSVIMSNQATFTVATPEAITYTTPGNIPYHRPLRINSGFTRITNSIAGGLDYWFEVKQSLDRYNEIGFKSVEGPWPYELAYQPTYPLGTFFVYPNPTQSGIAHLFVDLILAEFTTLNQAVNLPEGYSRALKKLLALELCPIFGKNPSPQLVLQAKEAKKLVQGTNSVPVVTLRYDSDLVYSRHTDAGWIVNGGFV